MYKIVCGTLYTKKYYRSINYLQYGAKNARQNNNEKW